MQVFWSAAGPDTHGYYFFGGNRESIVLMLISFMLGKMYRYLDQLAMAAKYHTEVYCRQSLIGGNYGLLNKTTFVPNPDYYR